MVAAAKEARIKPMVVGDNPTCTPKIGTTKVWVSQAAESNMLAIKTFRSDGLLNKSLTLCFCVTGVDLMCEALR